MHTLLSPFLLASNRVSPAAARFSSWFPHTNFSNGDLMVARSQSGWLPDLLSRQLPLFSGGSMPLASHHCGIRLFRKKLGVRAVCDRLCCVLGQVLCSESSHFWMQDLSHVCKSDKHQSASKIQDTPKDEHEAMMIAYNLSCGDDYRVPHQLERHWASKIVRNNKEDISWRQSSWFPPFAITISCNARDSCFRSLIVLSCRFSDSPWVSWGQTTSQFAPVTCRQAVTNPANLLFRLLFEAEHARVQCRNIQKRQLVLDLFSTCEILHYNNYQHAS